METQTGNKKKKANPIIQIGILALFLIFSDLGKIGFGIGVCLIIIVILLINKKLNKSGYNLKDLSGENSINILKYLFNEDSNNTNNKEVGCSDKIMTQTNTSDETQKYNDFISGKFTKKIGIITSILGFIPLLFILVFFGLLEFPKIKTNSSISLNNLLSGNSIRIRIILAILLTFIIFKVIKAIIDSKKYNKDSFKS